MLHVDALPPDTGALYAALRDDPNLSSFVLVGGTALALHHRHRVSDDLDFFCLTGTSLPPGTVDRIVARLSGMGLVVVPATDPIDVQMAENEGFDLPAHQRDFAVGGAKLTFAVWQDDAAVERAREALMVVDGEINVLGSDPLFETKARLLVRRCTARDRFDLWYFIDCLGKDVEALASFVRDENLFYHDGLIRQRLLGISRVDPGFQPLAEGAPRDQEELRARLSTIFAAYEERQAEVLSATPLR